MKTKIEIYKAVDGYRWRMKRAGRIVAESGEAYTKKVNCTNSLFNLIKSFHKFAYTTTDKTIQ